ncbi:anthrone oxygenase family protein [Flavisolibacter tropicus]|uniref:DUF1772 domain-containing protein n=1 Tax=Flavisolibacter tropicus TaxID=1492898 RepID=A0A172TWR7_9BACT|nr:anthrone oxygenase family protein [Flavisolibacter tropicus]ANE51324.1 hypothetical protein SY85_13185 [Flavisolibacter tropicus]
MRTTLIAFISLLLLLLVTGVFWGTWFTLTRSIDSFSAEEFIHIGKVIIANVAVPMRILMPAAILFVSLWVVWYYNKKSIGFYFGILGLATLLITLLITLLVLVPIDNQIKEWDAATVPAEWTTLRHKWQAYHAGRTITSIISFACVALSVILSKKDEW